MFKKNVIFRSATPEKIFLILSVTFGLVFCFATAPFQVPDEFAHFYRAYQVSTLKLLPDVQSNYEVGGLLPASFQLLEQEFLEMTTQPATAVPISKLTALMREPIHAEQTEFFQFKNSAIYLPVGYFPQALGILSGRLFGAKLLWTFYLGRIFNLLNWALITYAAIRKTPLMKWAFLIIALMPMTITQAASFSVDGILNGLTLLLVALILRAAYDDSISPHRKDYALWILLFVLITLFKPAYLAFFGIILVIPQKKFAFAHRLTVVFAMLALSFIAYAAWINLYTQTGIDLAFDDRFSPERQAAWIFNHGSHFLTIIVTNYIRMAFPLIISCIGYLGWLNQPLPAQAYPAFILFFLFIILFDNHYPSFRVENRHRMIFLSVLLVSLFVIPTGIYILTNPVGYDRIDGIQGRYYIPLLPLFCLMVSNSFLKIPDWVLRLVVPLLSSWFMLLALVTVLQRIQWG
jgi:uncharacterized membrane protein